MVLSAQGQRNAGGDPREPSFRRACDALTELLIDQGWRGPELDRRAGYNADQLLYALGLYAGPEGIRKQVSLPFTPQQIAWLAMRADPPA